LVKILDEPLPGGRPKRAKKRAPKRSRRRHVRAWHVVQKGDSVAVTKTRTKASKRTRTLEELDRKYFSAEQIAAMETAVAAEILELNLLELRKLFGMTQAGMAKTVAAIPQPKLSRAEHLSDHRLSTLRRYVEALGGELEVVARFDRKTVRLLGV
jgi:hypothetical protein